MSGDRLLKEGRILYAGVGNTLRGDDGAGCLAAAAVTEREGIHVCIAGENTEMIYHTALSFMPERVIIFDACDMGGAPGDFRLVGADEIYGKTLSTHKMPLDMICRLISEDTGAQVYIAGIQPKSMEPEAPVSDEVMSSVKKLADIINS